MDSTPQQAKQVVAAAAPAMNPTPHAAQVGDYFEGDGLRFTVVSAMAKADAAASVTPEK